MSVCYDRVLCPCAVSVCCVRVLCPCAVPVYYDRVMCPCAVSMCCILDLGLGLDFDRFPRASQLNATPHTPGGRCVFVAVSSHMLTGACDPVSSDVIRVVCRSREVLIKGKYKIMTAQRGNTGQSADPFENQWQVRQVSAMVSLFWLL